MSISEISNLDRDWTLDSPRQIAAGVLIDFGQIVCQPFFWACEQLALEVLLPKDDRMFAIFQRCIFAFLYAVMGTIFFTGWIFGSSIKMVGTALSGRPFIYQKGGGKEQWGKTFSLLSFNACMYESGFPMLLGGVMPASFRLERLIHLVQEKDPDILVLQEFSLGPSQVLMEALKEMYPHFYTNVGEPAAWMQHRTVGPELFIASKAPIISEPKFIPYEKGTHKMGFFCLETPTCWIVNAHFPEEDQEEVLRQVANEVKKLNKPCVLAGDLNYRNKIPKSLFYDAKNGTGDDFVLVDRASFSKGKIGVATIEEIPDPGTSWNALSDHLPIFAKIWTKLQGASP